MTEAIKTANTLARKTSINLALSFAANATDKKTAYGNSQCHVKKREHYDYTANDIINTIVLYS